MPKWSIRPCGIRPPAVVSQWGGVELRWPILSVRRRTDLRDRDTTRATWSIVARVEFVLHVLSCRLLLCYAATVWRVGQ